MLRLWRLRRVSNWFAKLEKDRKYNYFWIGCTKLLLVTLFVIHCGACFLYTIASHYPDPSKTFMFLHCLLSLCFSVYFSMEYYLKTRTCKFGVTCKFHHPRNKAEITGRVSLNMFGYPLRPGGMKGGPASHGASMSHRSIGSTVQRDAPGKVFKGRKMHGRMGAEQRTIKNVWIYKIDPARNLIWVRGQVPGAEGNFVFIKDVWYKKLRKWNQQS